MSDSQLDHDRRKLAYELDSWDLKVLLESGARVTVVDARSPQAWSAERIPGAINLPHRLMSREATQHLDREALLVSSCDGHPTESGATAATACGCGGE